MTNCEQSNHGLKKFGEKKQDREYRNKLKNLI